MKKLAILLTMFLGLTFSVVAQEHRQLTPEDFPIKLDSEIDCFPAGLLEKLLTSKYGELKAIEGKQVLKDSSDKQYYPGGMSMWINPDTLTYTIVATFNDALSCIILAGKDLQPYIKDGIKS